ncbi:putative Histidine kinase [Candidatus Zixiibacteriota bacterium]|nr:putative Histidine kinase [candidate division Zixibacteria bacterium]
MRGFYPLKILYWGLIIWGLHCAPVSSGVDHLIIRYNQKAELLPYEFVRVFCLDDRGVRKIVNRPFQTYRANRGDTSAALFIRANNAAIGRDEYASFALMRVQPTDYIDEDPVYITLWDYNTYFDEEFKALAIAASGYRNDSAFVIRHLQQTDTFDFIYLCRGQDHTGNGQWETAINFLGGFDYDFDGREEQFFQTFPGRDLEPRALFCVEMESRRVEWSVPVASVIVALTDCRDSANPSVIFSTYGTQNNVTQGRFNDNFGYLSKVNSRGNLEFNYIINADFKGTMIVPTDTGHSRFCIYHTLPFLPDTFSDSLPSRNPSLSLVDREGRAIRTIPATQSMGCGWRDRYRDKDNAIFMISESGVFQIYDTSLSLLAESNPTDLRAFVGKVKLVGMADSQYIFNGTNGLNLYTRDFRQLGKSGYGGGAVEPIIFDTAGNALTLLVSDPNIGQVMNIIKRPFGQYVAEIFWYYRELIVIMAVLLLAALLLINYFRQRSERFLYRSEVKRRALMYATPDLIFVVNSDGVFLDYKGNEDEKLLIPPDKFIGKNIAEVMPPKISERALELIREVIATRQIRSFDYQLEMPGGPKNYEARLVISGPREVLVIVRDITDWRQTEVALKESEEKYRTLVETAGEAIFMVDYHGEFLFMNSVAAGRLGGTPNDFVGKNMWQLFPQDNADVQMASIRETIQMGQKKSVERQTNLQNRVFWFNTSLRPVKNRAGEYYAVIAIATDVTAAHEAALALQKERDFSNSILDTANSLIVCLDGEAKITIFNRECERVTGYKRDEVIGRNWPDLFLPKEKSHPGLVDFADWVKKHPEDRKQEPILTKTGERKIILWSNSVLYSEDGQMTAIAIGHDITSRLETDRAFQESEEKMRTIFESSADGVTILDLDLNIIEANPASLKMFGNEKKGDVLGKNIGDFLPQEEMEKIPQLKQLVLRRGTMTNIELRGRHRNGREFPINVNASLLRGPQGGATGFVLSVEDISLRKREEIKDRARLQLLTELRTADTIDQCLTLGCNAIYNSGLYKRAVLTIHNSQREIIHLGQIGLDLIVLEQARKAPAPSREVAARLTQERYRISHSYFIPEDAGIVKDVSGRVIAQKDKGGGAAPSDWKPGDELFVPILSESGETEGWLSVDTPFDGRRPTYDEIHCLEEIVDIVTKRMHTVRGLDRLERERRALAQANIALAKSEANYRELIETAYDIIFTVNRAGKFIALNPAFERHTGWKPEEWLGRSAFETINQDDQPKAKETFSRVLGGYSPGAHEYRVKTKRGDDIICEFVTTPHYQDNKIIGVFGIARDITDRCRMERELRDSEEKFRNLAEHSLQGIMVVQDGRTVFINPRFAEIHEVAVPEILGTSIFDMIGRFIHPEFKDDSKRRHSSRMAGNPSSSNLEMKIITARGKVRWIETFAQNMTFDGRPAMQMVILDITDRKLAEAALRKSEEAYRDLVENVNDVLFSLDQAGKVTYVSPAIRAILGYDSAEVTGQSVWPLIYREDLPEIRTSLNDVFDGKLYPSEYRMIAKSGEVKWVRSSSRPVYEEGKVVGIRGVLVDIDRRKRTEEALAESEFKFRTLAEHSLQGMFVYQGEKYLFANRRVSQITGYSVEEILGTSVSELNKRLIHPDYRNQVNDYAGNRARGADRSEHYEIKIITKSGEERWVEIYSQEISFSGHPARQVVVADITDRKAAEAALLYRHAFEDLVTSISTRFIDLAPDEVEQGLEEAITQIGRFVGADLVYLFDILSDKNSMKFIYRWTVSDAGGLDDPKDEYSLNQMKWTSEMLHAQKNIYIPSLAELPIEASSEKSILNALGIKSLLTVPMIYRRRLIGGLGLASLKKEREFSEDIIALVRIVGEIFANTIERRRAEQQIQKTGLEKYQQARQIAGGMAHEIRNALFPVRGALSLIRRVWGESPPREKELTNYSKIADDAISRALDITGLISQYTKLDAEKFPGQVNPAEVVKEVLKSNQLRIAEQKIRVDVDCPDNIMVESNRRQLFIAINNIFINAMDALTKQREPRIIITGAKKQEHFTITISDNGEGIAAENLDKIFELFYSTKPSKGTGVGLASTKNIIQMYGGTIKVESRVNEGTSFILSLKIFGRDNNGRSEN